MASTKHIRLIHVAPGTHRQANLTAYRAVVVHDFKTKRYALVSNPSVLYVGQNGVTVTSRTDKTVRMSHSADIIDAYPR